MSLDNIIAQCIVDKNPTPYQIFMALLENFVLSKTTHKTELSLFDKYCWQNYIITRQDLIEKVLFIFILNEKENISSPSIKKTMEIKHMIELLSVINPSEFKNGPLFLSNHICFTSEIQHILNMKFENDYSELHLKKFQNYLIKFEISTGEEFLEKCLCPFMKYYKFF
jgi:hypothetical protein